MPRIRFVTSNPWNFDKKIIDVMKLHSNIMPYIHLPIQSGDETILRHMNRAMKLQDYYDQIDYIRKNIPTCAISTDIIVGFPNETAKQFANTIKMYKHIKFDNAYTFIYSPRIGTPAALIKDKVSLVTKQKRLAELNELVREYAKMNNEK
jgi:tRNA-2-methylthio-N6-dimethylallyladenosine synthase